VVLFAPETRLPPTGDTPALPTRVGPSRIHGRGLFAATNVPADTLILPLEGHETAEEGTFVIWLEAPDGPLAFEITNDARYVNHAHKPNAALYDDGLWSLRAIRRGEEITHDYGDDWDDL